MQWHTAQSHTTLAAGTGPAVDVGRLRMLTAHRLSMGRKPETPAMQRDSDPGADVPPPGKDLPEVCRDLLGSVNYAFQPMVQMRTGACHGFEALLRGLERTGFPTAGSLLDFAHACGVLAEFEAALHARALAVFRTLERDGRARLFLNI